MPSTFDRWLNCVYVCKGAAEAFQRNDSNYVWLVLCVSFYRKVAKWWLFWLAVMVYLDFGRIFVNWWTHTRCADDLYGRWDRDRWFFGSRRMGDLECKFCVLYFCCVFNCLRFQFNVHIFSVAKLPNDEIRAEKFYTRYKRWMRFQASVSMRW